MAWVRCPDIVLVRKARCPVCCEFLLTASPLLIGASSMGCDGLSLEKPPQPVGSASVPSEGRLRRRCGQGALALDAWTASPGVARGRHPSAILLGAAPAALTCGAVRAPSRSGGFGRLSPQTGERCDRRDVGLLPYNHNTIFSSGASQANGEDVPHLFARHRNQHARATIWRLPHRFRSSPASTFNLSPSTRIAHEVC